MTLFHPADSEIGIKGVTACPNAVSHGWLKEELTAIPAQLPRPAIVPGSKITMRSI